MFRPRCPTVKLLSYIRANQRAGPILCLIGTLKTNLKRRIRTPMAPNLLVRSIPVAVVACFLAGCTGADDPKIAEAPAPQTGTAKEPPKIPGRKDTYGAQPKYKERMDRPPGGR